MTTRLHLPMFAMFFVTALAVWCSVNSARQEARAEAAEAGSAPETPVEVSLVQLIATPDAFEGKYVRVDGFVRIEFEGTAVYLHRDDCEHMITRNGLWLEADVTAKGSKAANNHYALIVGQFNSKKKGHLDLWSGSIEKITRLEPKKIGKAGEK